MPATTELAITSERCSPFRQGFNADPVGSAGQYDAFLCVEVRLPWLRDISLHEPFASLGKSLSSQPITAELEHELEPMPFASLTGKDGRVWRPQGLVPTVGLQAAGLQAAAVRVIAYEMQQPVTAEELGNRGQQVEHAAPYDRREWLVAPADLLPLTQALIFGPAKAVTAFEPQQVQVPLDVIDLLICTHGKRDVCCGQSGTALYAELCSRLDQGAAPDAAQGAVQDGVISKYRLWRTSHTGGHRFAPTALTFPDGYAWAYLDAPASEHILQRPSHDEPTTGPTTEPPGGPTTERPVAPTTERPTERPVGPTTERPTERAVAPSQIDSAEQHCRGVSSLSGGVAQVADQAALRQVGWAWASAHRSVHVIRFDRGSMATTLLVRGILSDGSTRSFQVQVQLDRYIPQITCGVIEAPEYNVEAVWKVASVTQV